MVQVGMNSAMITGHFEVEVNGKLIHSRKNGDGFVDDDFKKNTIKAAIQVALKEVSS